MCLFYESFFSPYLNRQTKEIDESRGVVLVVNLVLVECGDFLIIERIGTCNARVDDVALVELELNVACHILLGAVNESRERLPERGVPFAVINELGKLDGEHTLVVLSVLVEADFLELVVSGVKD